MCFVSNVFSVSECSFFDIFLLSVTCDKFRRDEKCLCLFSDTKYLIQNVNIELRHLRILGKDIQEL
ncbi:CLUMA_CG017171, isoform A [Clunio marinus]|uniref:CLUMA_CG017171, isoform A n=1 Tax=Clunio marinus TaxID=568069 RepID=A0A1J1IWJ4_9DIPT|nr:CLUMA_CG017171, isoform A [Clunio marinus]